MVLVSYSGREINAKLVYYGPGLSGKTTNLEYIYSAIPQGHRGKMVSMKTKTERTLFFDFLPIHLGELSGFKTRFLLYTVPGQVYYNATRKLVLKGVDAIVFVADSKRGKMDENIESLENLRANLREHGVDLNEIPWVIQYNKRDLPEVYSIEELERTLNPGKVPSFEAVATTGNGVFESFKTIARMLLKHLSAEIGVKVVASEEKEQSRQAGAPAAVAAAPAPVAAAAPAPVAAAAPAPVSDSPPAHAEAPRPYVTGPQALSAGEACEEDEGSRTIGMGDRLKRWFSRGRDRDEEEDAAPVAAETRATSASPAPDPARGTRTVSVDLGEPPEMATQPAAAADPAEVRTAREEALDPAPPPPPPPPSPLSSFSLEPPPAPEPARGGERPSYREVPILVDLDPEDLRSGVVLKLRIAVRQPEEAQRTPGEDRFERAA